MKTRLLLVWAAAWSLGAALVDRFRPLRDDGMVTEDDAAAFVADMHDAATDPVELVVRSAPVYSTPIFDVLAEEWPALYARRLRALRWPTSEIEIQWRGLTSVLELDWLCAACESACHADCPGCSCSCSLVVTA